MLADLPQVSESLERLVKRLDSVSADLPNTSAQLRQTVQRLNRLISSQQQDIEKTVDNLRSISGKSEGTYRRFQKVSVPTAFWRAAAAIESHSTVKDVALFRQMLLVVLSLCAGCVGVEKGYPDKRYFVLDAPANPIPSNPSANETLQVSISGSRRDMQIKASSTARQRQVTNRTSSTNF